MKAEILTIGDEILIGQIVDTNSAWLGQELNLLGIKVNRINSISDDHFAIISALEESLSRADIVLITGGLGPTKDDITKKAIADFFQVEMIFNEDVMDYVASLFAARGIVMAESNKSQAMLPANCKVLHNSNGTAPGMWFEKDNKVIVSMPGVPYEMKGIFSEEVIPSLKQHFKTPIIKHKTVLTQGVGESTLMEKIETWENSLAANALKLAYLPQPGMVRLRISGVGENEKQLEDLIQSKVEELQQLIPSYIFGYDNETLEQVVGQLLAKNGKTLSTAESCTGGYIAHLITSISGSSAYFMGSVVAYDNRIKEEILNVSHQNLIDFGAVSQQVVEEMALGVQAKFKTDYAIATSGIAGPTGGTAEKPVGTVWVAIASPLGVKSKLLRFGNSRERNIRQAAIFALNLLRKEIL